MKQFAVSLAFLCVSLPGFAQEINLKKRYSFAKSYIGVDLNYFQSLSPSSFLDAQGQVQSLQRSTFFTPAINIGATHFWGHADFFVSIATAPIPTQKDAVANSIGFRAITGMRVFPLPLQEQTIRPYLSYKFAPIRLNQSNIEGENYRKTQVKSLLGGGIAYQTDKIYAYAAYEFIPNSDTDIHIARNQQAASAFPSGTFSIGLNYLFESTAGSYQHPSPLLDSLLRQKNTLGLFLGIGPSSSFPLQSSSYITELYSFLDDKSMPNTFPEITLGYHFSKQDFIISANFRPIRQTRNAFSFQQDIRRQSYGLEAYKFLFDYHGFAPFVGAGLLLENVQLTENDRGNTITDERHHLTSPSIVFGWDIRPNRRADTWLLRTNLRYSPLLEIEKDDKSISLQHLEFNFIQLVVYPQKILKYKALR